MKNLRQYRRSLGSVLNLGPPEYKAGVLTTGPWLGLPDVLVCILFFMATNIVLYTFYLYAVLYSFLPPIFTLIIDKVKIKCLHFCNQYLTDNQKSHRNKMSCK
jgi:hypothetical protein